MIEQPSEKDEIYLANVSKIGNSVKNIHYMENILSTEEHNKLLDYARSFNSWYDEPWEAKSIRSSMLSEEIYDLLRKVFTFTYEKAKKEYDVEINLFQNNAVQIVKFVKGFSLQPHADTLSVEMLHIASVYYINDDYLGGEINFPEHNLKIKPKANSLILFPGNENYIHEVLEIIDGDRYSSAMWFQFTGSTFNKKAEWNNVIYDDK